MPDTNGTNVEIETSGQKTRFGDLFSVVLKPEITTDLILYTALIFSMIAFLIFIYAKKK